MKKTNLILSCAAVALLSACSLTPEYQRPDMPVATAWNSSTASVPAAEIGWQSYFQDPALQSLIQRALDNNRDLRIALINVELVRAAHGIAQADLLPRIDGSTGGTVNRDSRNSLPPSATANGLTSRSYTASVGVTAFELDLFGKTRALNEQALEKYLATAEARTATQISLVAEVANAYLTLLADRKLLALTEETLATARASLEMVKSSKRSGESTELDVAQARILVETARANRARYQRQVAQHRNALELLIGAPVDAASLAAGDLVLVRLMDLAVGLPSEVLLRRPDIASAEHALKAANASIGAARAAYFPSISLTGNAGLASRTLDTLLSGGGSGMWSFGPAITLPIFNGGRLDAEFDSAQAGRDLAVAKYEKAIQQAFREVADALDAKGSLAEQLEAQAALVEANKATRDLAKARFETGVDTYFGVLDFQRSLFAAQLDLVGVQLAQLNNQVMLFKAVAGGGGQQAASRAAS